MIFTILESPMQINSLYLFKGVRYRSVLERDVSGTHLCVGEVVSHGHLMSVSGADAALASVSAAEKIFHFNGIGN